GVLGGCLPGDYENTAADHGTDAERGQPPGTKRALEAGTFARVRVGEIGLLYQESIEHGAFRLCLAQARGRVARKKKAGGVSAGFSVHFCEARNLLRLGP